MAVAPQMLVPTAINNESSSEILNLLLNDLTNQNINKNNFEVIVSNDRSEDKTKEIINEYSNKYKFIKAIHISKKNDMASKKYALEKAINESNGEIILATDADCRVSNNWVVSMANLVNQTN